VKFGHFYVRLRLPRRHVGVEGFDVVAGLVK
jgi:hypothetical protein